VPTGNFGDIFAGFVACQMGLPLGKLVIATNENDILTRALATGRYEPHSVQPTDSPSMDIQISSNFERLLFEAGGRNPASVRQSMADLRDTGGFEMPAATLAHMRERFSAHRVSREEAAAAMRSLFEETGCLVDPHTAVGLAAAKKERERGSSGPMVVLATAHPAKFPDAVQRATGKVPDCPDRLRERMTGAERFTVLPNSAAAVANYIQANESGTRGRKENAAQQSSPHLK
jgi:threonine synthase